MNELRIILNNYMEGIVKDTTDYSTFKKLDDALFKERLLAHRSYAEEQINKLIKRNNK